MAESAACSSGASPASPEQEGGEPLESDVKLASGDLDYSFDEEYQRQLQANGIDKVAADEAAVGRKEAESAGEAGEAASPPPKAALSVEQETPDQGTPNWDVSHGSRKKGLSTLTMVLPAVTRVATLLVGSGIATSGYVVGKMGEVVTGEKAVDSKAFQAGFTAWLWSNGLFPKVQYEPLVEGSPGAAVGAGLNKEDMNITPIIVSNHISYLDGVVLASLFNAPKIVAMAGSKKVPVLGKLMQEMEVVFVDRSAGDSRKATAEAIQTHCTEWSQGKRPLLIFPEGRTTNGEGLVDFKKGAFNAGVPVRPVLIVYTGHFDPATTTYHQGQEGAELHKTSDAEWAAQFMGHFIHSMHVRVLPPYTPSEAERSDPETYAANVRSYMATELDRVRSELVDRSWKACSGREEGGLDYKFGDLTRWFIRSSKDMVCCMAGSPSRSRGPAPGSA